jgi:hypothetical protein
MDKAIHHFSELFAQLGLPDDAVSIADFLAKHTAMSVGMRLPDAPYWAPAQAKFLRESLLQDSDWAGLVDHLSKALQGEPQSQSQSHDGQP